MRSSRDPCPSISASGYSVLIVYQKSMILPVQCWQSKDFLQLGPAGWWGKDAVGLVYFGMLSTSHFAPSALSFDWILLFQCSYQHSAPTDLHLNMDINDLSEGEDRTLQTDIQAFKGSDHFL